MKPDPHQPQSERSAEEPYEAPELEDLDVPLGVAETAPGMPISTTPAI